MIFGSHIQLLLYKIAHFKPTNDSNYSMAHLFLNSDWGSTMC